MKIILLVVWISLVSIVQSVIINVLDGLLLTNSFTLATNTRYQFKMTFSTTTLFVPSDSYLEIQFGQRYSIDQFSLSNCQYSTTTTGPYIPTVCTTKYSSINKLYLIQFFQIFKSAQTINALNIIFNITNPYGGRQVTESILIYILLSNGVDNAAQGLVTYSYEASLMNNCLYTSSSDTTSISSQRVITFTPSVLVYPDSEIVVNLPPYFYQYTNINTGVAFACFGLINSDSPNPPCTSQFFSEDGLTPAYEEITIQSIILSKKTFNSSIQIKIQYLKNPFSLASFGPITFQLKQKGIISQRCTNIYHTNTKMNTPTSATTGLSTSPTISTSFTTRTIRFSIKQPFPSLTGRLRVTFPNSLQILYSGTLIYENTTSNGIISLAFAGISGFDIINSGSLNLTNINYITPPSSRPFYMTINSEHIQSGLAYGINSINISFACRTGDITETSIKALSYSINTITQYDLSFKIANQLIADSFIIIILPFGLSLTTNATCSTTNIFGSCSIVNTSAIKIQVSGVIIANSTINMTSYGVLNGIQAVTTPSFEIWTYYDAGLDSIVDKITTGISVTFTSNPIIHASVTSLSTITYETTSYIFTATLIDPIPANGFITISVPPAITLGTLILTAANFPIATCTIVNTTNNIRINGCFSVSMSNLNFSISISGFINPQSLEPTSSFSIQTFGPNGQVNFITSGLNVTMLTATTANSFTISTVNNTVSTFSTYKLSFNFKIPHSTNQYAIFNIPSSMAFSSTPSCSSVGISNVSCNILNQTSLRMIFGGFVSQISQISINNIRNFDIATTVTFSFSILNINNFLKQISSTGSVTYVPSSLRINLNHNDQIALYENSNLTVSVTSPHTLQSSFQSSLTQLIVVLPSSFTIRNDSSCTSIISPCVISNNSIVFNSVGLTLSSFLVTLNNIVLPYFNPNSQTLILQYSYNGTKVSVSNSSINFLSFCTSPCQRCSSLATTCKSCLPTPNNLIYLFSSNNSCLAVCPNTFYPDSSKNCLNCVPPCSSCNDSITCTSCVNLNYLYQNRCNTTCPATTYANSSTGVCQMCINPCFNCTSLTACLSCNINYFINFTCVNASNCPMGTFPDDANKQCSACPVTCNSCINLTSCTSCQTGYFLYNNTCINTCPNGTFSLNGSCSLCTPNCSNCQGSSTNCTSCISPSLYHNNSCLTSCINGTYSDGSKCVNCLVTCQNCLNGTSCTSCATNLFFNNGSCSSGCPTGTFTDLATYTCTTCSPTCSACQGNAANCTSCPPNLSFHQGSCSSFCPTNYFSVGGICKTCQRCRACSVGLICTQCQSGNFMLNGVCYSTCPSISVPNLSTLTCTLCDPKCASCSITITNCLTCSSSLYLMNGVCQSSCPSGYIPQESSRTCVLSKLGNIVYFPFSITFLVVCIIIAYAKNTEAKTDTVTSLCGFLGLILWFSWLIFIIQAISSDLELTAQAKSLLISCGIIGLSVSVIIGSIFTLWFRNLFKGDSGFKQWINYSQSHLNLFRVIFIISFISFSNFRIIYSRLFNKPYFSSFIFKAGSLLSTTVTATILHIIFAILPFIFLSAYIIFIKKSYDQTLISAIDSLLLGIVMIILLTIDAASKDQRYFLDFLQDQPYLKKVNYDEINNSTSSMRDFQGREGRQRPHTAINFNKIDDFFREKITIIEDLNKFGHLNKTPQVLVKQRKIKTLPNDLENYPQFDLHQDQIKVIDDQFFNQQDQINRRLREEEEAEEQRRRRQLEEDERRRKQQQQRLQKQRRRRQQQEQDLDQLHQIQFPDLAAIEKHERKSKPSPTQLLNKFKKIEERSIGEKDMKKLQQMAKKNGLNKQFMCQTFGIQKNFNPNLLNQIIDIHNHVKRDSVKQLFSPQANPAILQQLFSKNSLINPERLRNLLNSKESAAIIQSLTDKQKGIVSPQIAKLLLNQNSKYSQQFVNNLLNPAQSCMDSIKLQSLLRDNPNKEQSEMILKNLKKIGGNNLQNKQLLKNLLGKDSLLDKDVFLKVTNELPIKIVQQLFSKKSERNDIIIEKLLNNKKINLKSIAPLLEDPQMLNLLAQALMNGNQNVQQNLINLFKNGEILDKDLLKQMLKNPITMNKMMTKHIDPAFLTNLLKKDAKTNLKLLQQSLKHMTDDQIAQVFQYKPQKNIDMEKLSKLFQYNHKTDPKLIAQFLNPELVNSVYSKSNNLKAQMLNKLVQKGKIIDTNQIIKIYGNDVKKNGEDNLNLNEIMDRKYNITDSHFNVNKLNGNQEDNQLSYEKQQLKNSMSRTDGGMLGFLNPVNVALNKKNKKNSHFDQIDQISDENTSEFASQELDINKQDDDEYQYEGEGKNRKKKRKRKPVQDIRLPSEHIYLQRLQAPHELKKKNIRKKKKASSSMQKLQKMDEENQVYDLDF